MSESTPATNHSQVWADALSALSKRVSAHNYEHWLASIELARFEDEHLRLYVRDDFHAEWVEDNYRDMLLEVLAEVGAPDVEIELTTEPDAVEQPSLPFWPDDERSAPNEFLRSALFGVVRRGRRKHYDNEILDSWRGVEMRYTGESLDQADLDVWLQAVQLMRENEYGKRIFFTMKGFLRELGRATGGNSQDWLKRSFRRMTACAVELRADGKVFGGSLINNYGWDEYTGEFFLVLDEELARLFADDLYTRLHWETRLELSTDFARWLHGYLASHRTRPDKPHRIRLEMLAKLSRSSFSRFRDFRRKVREACAELAEAGIIAQAKIEDDILVAYRAQRAIS